MEIPYSILPQPSQISERDSEFQSEEHDEPHSTTAVLAVAAHIRSFYRVFGIIAVLLVFSGVGIATIIIGYIKSNSCPASRNMCRWLRFFGIIDIITCGFVAIIVIARVTCCYHRNNCLLRFLLFLIQILISILVLALPLMNISDGSTDPATEYQPTIQTVTKNCENSVQYIVLIIEIGLVSILFSTYIYLIINNCKNRCRRNVNSSTNSTAIV